MNDASEPILALPLAADVQEHLVAACNDLERLQVLLDDACETLMASFHGAAGQLDPCGDARLDAMLGSIRRHLGVAITALQFHDLGTQLLGHTRQRLRGCADRLACDVFGRDEDEEGVVEPMPLRPNPVTTAEMDAGSIELFS